MEALFSELLWPLLRLLCGLACGLFLAGLLESLAWTRQLARLGAPLAAAAHLGPVPASAFALAFVSPASANALLSEKHDQGGISLRELMLANLFNGLPACFSHTPTILLLLWPVLGAAAAIYVGLTLIAAFLRAGFTILLARWLLPKPEIETEKMEQAAPAPFRQRLAGALAKTLPRFRKRLWRLILFTAPVYALMYWGQQTGFFQMLEAWLAEHLDWLTFLKPQAMGIIAMQFMAEMGATLGAAGAALQDSSLTPHDVVAALLAGNVLSTPLRAIRHQLPAYCGFYRPKLAVSLVLANQALRAASMIAVIAAYLFLHP